MQLLREARADSAKNRQRNAASLDGSESEAQGAAAEIKNNISNPDIPSAQALRSQLEWAL